MQSALNKRFLVIFINPYGQKKFLNKKIAVTLFNNLKVIKYEKGIFAFGLTA